MTLTSFHSHDFDGTGPANYERHFVPRIGAPLARDLVQTASLRPGERVLDLACGTGIVARLASEEVGAEGRVAGLDVNPGMLEVARATTTAGAPTIDWLEASAEAMPLPADSFDVVLCQMGLQFVPDKVSALRETKRVLAPGGRLVANAPGPTPPMFAALGEVLAQHVDPRCAAFVNAVFSLDDPDALRAMMTAAGFEDITVDRTQKCLRLPEPEAFLWQYTHSTPLAGMVGEATDEQRAAVATDIRDRWQPYVDRGVLTLELGMTTVLAS